MCLHTPLAINIILLNWLGGSQVSHRRRVSIIPKKLVVNALLHNPPSRYKSMQSTPSALFTRFYLKLVPDSSNNMQSKLNGDNKVVQLTPRQPGQEIAPDFARSNRKRRSTSQVVEMAATVNRRRGSFFPVRLDRTGPARSWQQPDSLFENWFKSLSRYVCKALWKQWKNATLCHTTEKNIRWNNRSEPPKRRRKINK